MKSVMYEWKKFRIPIFWFFAFYVFNILTLSENGRWRCKRCRSGETDLRRFEGTAGRKSVKSGSRSFRKRKFLFIRGMNMQKRCCTTKIFQSTDRSTDTTNILRRSRKKSYRVCPALFSE